MKRTEIIKFLMGIWGKHSKDGDIVYLARKHQRGMWKDHPFIFDSNLKEKLINWFDTHSEVENDLYWCPTPFKAKRRIADNVKSTKFLWQDLDYANPKFIEPELQPTVIWESSPGRFQALWELDKLYSPQDMEEVNRSLAYHVGADKGGWDLSQVLRIPGTTNNKYLEKPKVKLISSTPGNYQLQKIKSKLDKEMKSANERKKADTDDDLPDIDPSSVLAQYHKKIPRKVLSLLLSKNATEGKRSDIIWYLENKLYEAGLTPPEIISLIKNSVWNKYAGRHDEDERLTIELEKILESKMGDKEDDTPNSSNTSRKGLQVPEELSLTIENYQEVMGSSSSFPGWAVDGFWGRRSHGIVAGEPKSFKSTFMMDLVVSIASGKPFLDQFEVHEPGPVLIIQNENADFIIRDKIEKIIAGRGLAGKVKRKGNRKLSVTFAPDLPIHFVNQQGFILTDELHRQILEKMIEQIKPVLVVFDPLYLMFDGDMNSAKDLNPVLSYLLHLKNHYRTGIMVIHHYNKGGQSSRGGQRMLGSTFLHGWVESAWYLKLADSSEEGDEDGESVVKVSGKPVHVILDREFRSAGSFPKVDMALTMGAFGDPTYSVEVQKHVGKGHPSADIDDLTDQIMDLLEINSGPVSQRKISESTGVGRRLVKRALDQLAEEGKINVTKEGVTRLTESSEKETVRQ